jgi:cysteine desulfuration protein SufE
MRRVITGPLMSINAIREDFALLDDWEDRYRYIIELGRALPPMTEAMKNETTKVRGCASQVWLTTEMGPPGADGSPTLTFHGDSDAHIVRGLVAILLEIYKGRTAREISTYDPTPDFASIGLKDHLTPQRSNGLASMVERLGADARAAITSA